MLAKDFFASAPVKAKDAICNPVVMSVLLSVCNKPRPLTSRAIISSGQADAKLPGDQRLVWGCHISVLPAVYLYSVEH